MNHTHRFILIAAFLSIIAAVNCSGQGFYVTAPAFSAFNAVGIFNDNSYVVAGDGAGIPRLQKVTTSGQLLWTTNAGLGMGKAVDVSISPDGSVGVLAQYFNNLHNALVKVDGTGNTVWVTSLPNEKTPNGLTKIIAATDGSFYAAGNTQTSNGLQGVRLVKINTDGSIAWEQVLGDPLVDEQATGLSLLPDGSIALGGITRQGTETDFFLMRVDEDGSLIWQQNYPQAGRQSAYDLLTTTDGNLALLGYQLLTNPTKICLLKADADNGALIWNRSFFLEGGLVLPGAPAVSPIAEAMAQDQSGHFFLTVVTGFADEGTGQLLHLDDNGLMAELVPLPALRAITDIVTTPDGDLVMAGATNFATGVLLKSDPKGGILPNRISGGLYGDTNQDCNFTNGEAILSGWVLEAKALTGESRYTATDTFGRFTMTLPSGEFRVIVHSPSGSIPFWEACDTPLVNFIPGTTNAVNLGFTGVKATAACPLMALDIQTGTIQPCGNHLWQVKYFNAGAIDAENVTITIEKSAFTDYISSSLPLITQNGNSLTFAAGRVKAGMGGVMVLQMFVSCTAPLGSAICTHASVSPKSNCLPAQPVWDGSIIEVSQTCISPGQLRFLIHNKGLGDMVNGLEYVIIEDQIILFTGHFQLDANEDTLITIDNPTGGAYWMRTGQSPGQYSLDLPTVFADNCNNPADNDSLALQLPANEANIFISEHCGLVQIPDTSGTWLTGFPLGWQEDHQIAADQEIEYIIHFKNIPGGNIGVITIHDSLPANLLALSTLRPGASSHPYDWTLTNEGLLYFRIANINLPDVEEGFISFKITPQPGLLPGTVIHNRTVVRFDYSPRLLTNETFHTIGGVFVKTVTPVLPRTAVKVIPNPFRDHATIVLMGWNREETVHFVLTDILGRVLQTDQFSGSQYPLDTSTLAGGTYYFQLFSGGKTIAAGRFVALH